MYIYKYLYIWKERDYVYQNVFECRSVTRDLQNEKYCVYQVDEEEADEEGLEPRVVGGVDLVAVGGVAHLGQEVVQLVFYIYIHKQKVKD